MLNIFYFFKEQFCNSLNQIAKEKNIEISEQEIQKFTIEPTKEKSHGDLACNVAMIFNKKFNLAPRELAELIIKNLNQKNIPILKTEIAGAGFINLFLKSEILFDVIKSINNSAKIDFPNLGKSKKVNLEYASPNPTGPIHIGHTRGAIYGDVLAKLLQKVGYDVLKEYYINDAGAQINVLIKSAYMRYLEALGQNIEIPQGLYPGEYLIEIGKKIKDKFGEKLLNKNEEEYSEEIRDFVVDSMLDIIKSDLLDLGIKHDSYFSEKKELHDKQKIDEALKILSSQNLIYNGKLEAPKTEKGVGATPEEYEENDQTLFRSKEFGDDQDRVVKKSDGTPTYFAADLAYIMSKFERGAEIFIMPLGFDHAGYVKRLTAAVKALTNDKAILKVILCQMVKFVKNGEPLKMSKRAGNFITAREVIDEVGADALRFIMLTRKNDAPFDFDLSKVIEQSKDNPIFYVQYAHARCCSVIRNLKVEMPELSQEIFDPKNNFSDDFSNFECDESELNLIKKLAGFTRIIEMSAQNFEPHRLAFYLQELSAEFHALWNKGTDNPQLKFIIKEDKNKTKFRIYLVNATKKIIAEGLDIFNIKAVEEMR